LNTYIEGAFHKVFCFKDSWSQEVNFIKDLSWQLGAQIIPEQSRGVPAAKKLGLVSLIIGVLC